MKKKLGVLLLLLLFTTACSKDSGTITCTNEVTSSNNVYKTNMKSIISYENKYLTTITTDEIIYTETKEQALDFKRLLDDYYIKYNKLNGFNNTVTVSDKTVTSKTTIDYKNIDTSELINIDESNKNLIKNNKISIDDMIKNLENQGAKCK